MKLSQFKFKLTDEDIALEPSYHRDECRLMILHRKSNKIDLYRTDENGEPLTDEEGNKVYLDFRNVLDHFDEGDVFVFNDTKVFPARLYGTKERTDAKIEVFLLRELNEEMRLWDVLVEPARKIRIGNKLFFDDSGTMVAEVIDNTTSRGRTLRFLYDCPHDKFKKELYALGEAPLPHYIVDRRAATEGGVEIGYGSRLRPALQPRADEENGDKGHQFRLYHPALRLRQFPRHRGGGPDQAQDGLRADVCGERGLRHRQ